jgi:hypothetical protein
MVLSDVTKRRAIISGATASALATRRNIDEAVSPSEA